MVRDRLGVVGEVVVAEPFLPAQDRVEILRIEVAIIDLVAAARRLATTVSCSAAP